MTNALEDFCLKEEKNLPFVDTTENNRFHLLFSWKANSFCGPQISWQIHREKGLILALEFFHCRVLITAHVHKFGELFSPHGAKRKLK